MSALKVKITQEGEPCRKCGERVVKRIPTCKPAENQWYAFRWYLWCPKCGQTYMVETAKYIIQPKTKSSEPAYCACGRKRRKQLEKCKGCLRREALIFSPLLKEAGGGK
ncbi:MAG TPA: hypothetical protein DCS05_08590 [Nitrospiraceae bacterium]|nr:hypothetical protein [Nitrospiraceae bacterium]